MKFTIKILTSIIFVAAMGISTSAGTMEDQALGQLRSFGSFKDVEAATKIPVPEYAPARDIFAETPACSILNAQFIMKPFIKDALSMLKPCLAGVSKITGNVQISAGAVKNDKAIEIAVLGGKNEAVKELIRASLAKRNNAVFGYPATAVLHVAFPL
ncbi:MAG: hypothetical protein WCK75_10325 [Elusimicrobiota bacterium]